MFLCLFSCETDSKKYQDFHFGKYTMKIKTPIQFKTVKIEDVNKVYEDGSKTLKKHGYRSNSNKEIILFLKKDEFSSIKIKNYPIDEVMVRNYKSLWTNLKKTSFDVLSKEKMPNSKIDSTSRREKINGIEFYVYETNISFMDLKNNPTNFKTLKYSTPLNDSDFVIDISYVNNIDEELILNTVKSIKINKKPVSKF